MVRLWAWVSLVMFILCFDGLWGQTAIPDHLPELKYPPIARAAHVQGDVVISFRVTAGGSTTDVSAVSGPVMLRGIVIDDVKAWQLNEPVPNSGQLRKATFHFALEPPADGYNEGQAVTKVEVSGDGDIRVFSVATTGLNRSECPFATEPVPAPAVIDGDFVELHRWNEVVRVSADGVVTWRKREQGGALRRGHIELSEARALLERFRTPAVWGLCGSYDQARLTDGDSSSFKVRIGGREKSAGEYGDVAPPHLQGG
jgi:hypothetical protein